VLALTATGRALLASAIPVWETTHAEIERPLSPGAPDRLRQDLNDLAR